ncbi:MAG: Outer rane lipoproteinsorting protein [Bacteroidota bacterium]|nr:Outer rane lipoproteinsorting protein [Bacteroidota bacterium]
MKLIILFLLLMLSAAAVYSQTAEDIVKKAEDAVKGESSYGTFTMNIVTPDYSRSMTMKTWWVGNEKALIVVVAPLKDKGNKTLKIKNEIWSYLKKTETKMKLPPSMMLQSWNGSDLTNDDLVRESNLVRDYYLKILAQEKISAETCWKIELKPKPDAPVVWGTIYYWVRQSDYLPALTQYYDEKGTLIRTFKFEDVKNMSGRRIPCKWTIISNTKENHYTEFIYDDVKFDTKIPENIFSFKELEK